MKKIFYLTLIAALMCSACANEPVVIFQVSDPQLGFRTNNADIAFESALLTEAVEIIGQVKPDAVVFTGDLVHNAADSTQWEAFNALVDPIAKSGIKAFYIPGNHDGKIGDGTVDMTPFLGNIGDDHFSTLVGNVLLTGINSNYIKYAPGSEEETEQKDWLGMTTSTGKPAKGYSIVFSHHPFFLFDRDEEEEYFNIRPDVRAAYLDLYRDSGVDAVFCGHLHRCAEAGWDGIRMVTTSAVGMPLGDDPSGLRVIVCDRDGLHHRYIPLEELPSTRAGVIEAVLSE